MDQPEDIWLLSNSSWGEARDIAVAAALGLIIYTFYKVRWRAAHLDEE